MPIGFGEIGESGIDDVEIDRGEIGGKFFARTRKTDFREIETGGVDLWLGERSEDEHLAVDFWRRSKLGSRDDWAKLNFGEILNGQR